MSIGGSESRPTSSLAHAARHVAPCRRPLLGLRSGRTLLRRGGGHGESRAERYTTAYTSFNDSHVEARAKSTADIHVRKTSKDKGTPDEAERKRSIMHDMLFSNDSASDNNHRSWVCEMRSGGQRCRLRLRTAGETTSGGTRRRRAVLLGGSKGLRPWSKRTRCKSNPPRSWLNSQQHRACSPGRTDPWGEPGGAGS